MKANEWAAIAFGLLGFLMSCITLARSIKSDAASRTLSQRQERQDLLSLLIEAKLSYAASIRRWERLLMSISSRARVNVKLGDETNPLILELIDAINGGLSEVRETAEELITLLKDALANINTARDELSKQLPKKYSESLSQALSVTRVKLTELANGKLREEEEGPLFDKAMETLEKDNEARGLLARLRQDGKDGLGQPGDR